MNNHHLLLTLLTLIIVLALGACTLPAPGAPPTIDPVAAYTAAAQTIIAQVTQAAPTTTLLAVTSAPESPIATLAVGATQLPPPTETATPTPEPSPTPATTTPTALPSDPRASLGDPTWRDIFTSGDNWPLYEDDHVSFEVVDGTLIMTAFNPEYWDGWIITWPNLEDFYLEMTGTFKKCSGLDRYGMLVRATKTNKGYIGYFFGISCDGRFSLRSWNGNKFTTLVDWTSSDHLRSGKDQTNRFGIMAQGDRLSFYANGNKLGEIVDDTHDEGRFGTFVGSINTPDFTVQVSEIAYWDLP